jgi:RNA polymerase sigma factor (sigma-70 family)
MTDPENDSQLLSRFVTAGSQEAFARVVSRHINLVHAAAMRQVHDAHLAEDVTQSVFAVLARKARDFGPGTVVGAWLLNATWYVSRDLIKRENRRRRREQKRAAMTPTTTAEPDDAEDWARMAPVLDAALAGLCDADRRVIVLKYFEGRSDVDAAGILGVSENALRQRRFRGIQRLRAFFHRRGIVVTGELLAGQILAHAVSPAPPGLALSVSSHALAAASQAATASAAALLKGALIMAWLKTNGVMIAMIVLLLLTGTGLLAHNYFSRHQPQTVALKPDDGIPAKPAIPTRFTVGQAIPARAYTDKRGCQDFENGVGYLDSGCWLRYANVDFGDGNPNTSAANLVTCVAVPASNAGGEICARLDKSDGPVISRLKVASTGGWGKVSFQHAPVEKVVGLHDVYFTFSGSGVGNVFWEMFVPPNRLPSLDEPAPAHRPAATQPAGPATKPSFFSIWHFGPSTQPANTSTGPAKPANSGEHP